MRKLASVVAVVAALAAVSATPAFAAPNPDRGPGICIPPGQSISLVAKTTPGLSVPEALLAPPGQIISENCAPGRQP